MSVSEQVAGASSLLDDPELQNHGAFSRGFLSLLIRLGVGPAAIPTPREWTTGWLICFAVLLNHYDQSIYGLALPRIQESLGIAEVDVGILSAMMSVSIIPAFLLAFLADSVGRKRLLIFTLAMTAILTGLTALAPDVKSFYTLQILVRVFANAEDMLAAVVIVEAMRPEVRGWSIGAMAALGAAGTGLAAAVYSMVDLTAYDWRALYVVGTVPMFLALWLRRNLQETDHYLNYQAGRQESKASLFEETVRPLKQLIKDYPERVMAVAAAMIPFVFGCGPALFLMPKLLQDVHNYSSGEVSLLFLTGGTFAVMGNLLAGRVADRIGRKKVLLVAGLTAMMGGFVGYGFAAGALLVIVWMVTLFAFFAAATSFMALTGEIFPTSFRSTASAMRGIIGAIGAGGGLAAESGLYALTGSHETAIMILLCAVPVGMLALMTLLPETAGRELDDIAPEKHH